MQCKTTPQEKKTQTQTFGCLPQEANWQIAERSETGKNNVWNDKLKVLKHILPREHVEETLWKV